jgi:hypothetical protein
VLCSTQRGWSSCGSAQTAQPSRRVPHLEQFGGAVAAAGRKRRKRCGRGHEPATLRCCHLLKHQQRLISPALCQLIQTTCSSYKRTGLIGAAKHKDNFSTMQAPLSGTPCIGTAPDAPATAAPRLQPPPRARSAGTRSPAAIAPAGKRTKRLSLSQSTSKCVALLGSGHWLSSRHSSRWVFPPESIMEHGCCA